MKTLFMTGSPLLFSALLSASPNLLAVEICGPEHSKHVTLEATPTDPGHVEVDLTYSIRGGKFVWRSNAKCYHRGTFLTHAFDIETYVGFYKDIDRAFLQSFYHLLDKENNYNEVEHDIDPVTGEAMRDSTKGPMHGGGRGDLGVLARWRFYTNEVKKSKWLTTRRFICRRAGAAISTISVPDRVIPVLRTI